MGSVFLMIVLRWAIDNSLTKYYYTTYICVLVNPFEHLKHIIAHISITNEKEQFQTIIKLKWIEKKFRGYLLIEKIVGL